MWEWFAQVILYSEAPWLAGPYVPFGKLSGGVLAHAWRDPRRHRKVTLVASGVNAPFVVYSIVQPTLVATDVGEAARANAAKR